MNVLQLIKLKFMSRRCLACAAMVLFFAASTTMPLFAKGEDSPKAKKIQELKRAAPQLKKTRGFEDRKIGQMDNGQMVINYDNNGLFGDREFTRSIEWPAGSQNFFVWQAGIVFGAVTANGDTISSESYWDISDAQFNPESGFDNPDYVSPTLQTPIVARSDIAESFAPAWNGQWPGLDGTFIDAASLKNLARQESYWVMRDNNDPEVAPAVPLNLEVEARLMEINSSLTKDIVFAIYKVKNISGSTLSNCRFGVLVDPDMPALVGAEFADDDGGFVKDLDLSWARDTDNFYDSKPGFNIGHFGTKFLKSPVVDGEELGLTAWALFEYGDMPAAGEFPLTPDGPDPSQPAFASRDLAQYQYMTPGLFMKPAFNTDVVYLMSSGDFTLADGESVDMAVAFIAAPDFEGLIDNAIAAQTVFDNNFVGPTAPIAPAITAVPGNQTVTLYWDSEPSESSTDPLTGRADFEGYRIYRSEDRGTTWGEKTDNFDVYPNGFIPVAEYDVVNSPGELASVVVSHSNQVSTASITSLGLADGSHPGDAAGIDNSTFFSNDNFQIIFDDDSTFKVLNASQGLLLDYLGDLSAAVGFAVLDPDFNLLGNNPDQTHGIYRSGDVIYVTGVFVEIDDAPGNPVQAGDVFLIDQRKNDAGKNAGLAHSWTDPEELLNGYEYWYTVAAYDREDLALGVPVNENRAATVADAFSNDQTVAVIPQAPPAGFIPARVDTSFEHVAGTSDVDGFVLEVLDPRLVSGHTYEISFDTSGADKTFTVTDLDISQAVLSNQPFYDAAQDNAKLFDGMRLLVSDVEAGVNLDASGQVGDAVGGELSITQVRLPEPDGLFLDRDYELRFTDEIWTYTDWNLGTPVTANFAVFDVTAGNEIQITVEIRDAADGNGNGQWDATERERIIFVNTAYTGSGAFEGVYPDDYAWRIRLETTDPDGIVDTGNVFRVITNKPLTVADLYTFDTTSENVDASLAKNDMELIRVVPNPFIVTSGFDTVKDRHEVHFTRLPERCTIKIFTITGELVKTITHDRSAEGVNFARWDLKTEFGSEVAYGVYLYHIKSDVGTQMGKMAVMR